MSSTVATKERPILFSAPMVRAILGGKKTQTRRIVKPAPVGEIPWEIRTEWYSPIVVRAGIQEPGDEVFGFANEDQGWPCPYGAPGDKLWVREAFSFTRGDHLDCRKPSVVPRDATVWYRANNNRPTWAETKWHPSIFMPRWASRITLEITDVRVERVQEISKEDVAAEGINLERAGACGYKYEWFSLWGDINGRESWDANPWVWVVQFRKID